MARIEALRLSFAYQHLKRIKAGEVAGKHPIGMEHHRRTMTEKNIAREQRFFCRQQQARRILGVARQGHCLELRCALKRAERADAQRENNRNRKPSRRKGCLLPAW